MTGQVLLISVLYSSMGWFSRELKQRRDEVAERLYELEVADFYEHTDTYQDFAHRLAECAGAFVSRSANVPVYPEMVDSLAQTIFDRRFPMDPASKPTRIKLIKDQPYFRDIVRSGIPVESITLETEYEFAVKHHGGAQKVLECRMQAIASLMKDAFVTLSPSDVGLLQAAPYWILQTQRCYDAYQRVMGKP